VKVSKTKKMLKLQREASRRFRHFLPVLELKKHQLQIEVRAVDQELRASEVEENGIVERITPWIRLLSEDVGLPSYLGVREVVTETANVAGVRIPVLKDVVMVENPVDLFSTPPWIDEALESLRALIRLRTEHKVLAEQRRLLNEELRITSQRVNLFEKVKIPEAEEKIRLIRIGLGDAQTAGVGRAKIAKRMGRATLSGTGGVGEA
jgi:V/A-type H+-transporting ATPase subunit D